MSAASTRATGTSTGWRRIRPPRRTPPCASTPPTGAGRAYPSSPPPARACPCPHPRPGSCSSTRPGAPSPAGRGVNGASARPPSGEQISLELGPHRVTVVEVGGGLRAYALGGWDVLDGYGVVERCSGARGQPLIPWPNRLRDGRYRWKGAELQLDLSEPALQNAIHGLVRWRN